MTYTAQGNADCGTFDTAHSTISVKVSASKLNPFVTHGKQIDIGSALVGLWGSAFTQSGTAKGDTTRGGAQFGIC